MELVEEVVERERGRKESGKTSAGYTTFFLFRLLHSREAKKKRDGLDPPLSSLSLSLSLFQDGVFRADELAQLLRGRDHDERQGHLRCAAPAEARHDDRTSGRRAAPENVEKGRSAIVGGVDHDRGPELLDEPLVLLLFQWSGKHPLQRGVCNVSAGFRPAA